EITKDIKPSTHVKLGAGGTITGAVTGAWELEGDYFAKLIVNEVVGDAVVPTTYKGVFIRLWDSTTEAYVMTLSVLSGNGTAVWGSQLNLLLDQDLATNAANLLSLGDTSRIFKNITLPS